MTTRVRCAVTIAGSDSGGGAGIQADLKVFQAFDLYGASVVAAVTAQNSREVLTIEPVNAVIVDAQIDSVAADLCIDAVKTGMLVDAATVSIVAAAFERHMFPNLVIDPVFVATNGTRLLDDEGISVLSESLLPHARCVTPNAAEAAILVGEPVESLEQMVRAAECLCAMGADSAVVTGGHLGTDGPLIDVLCDGAQVHELHATCYSEGGGHGTGCAFSAALAAGLASGLSVYESVRGAQHYVGQALASGFLGGAGETLLWHGVRPAICLEGNNDQE
jgi:hydroxymethylpyrimidine kinase/phosphomethylpyrimidine kinase